MLNGTVEGHLNVQRFYETLARILGEQNGVKLTVTAKRKIEVPEPEEQEKDRPIAI